MIYHTFISLKTWMQDINWNFTKQEIVALNILPLQYMNEDKSQYKKNQGR